MVAFTNHADFDIHLSKASRLKYLPSPNFTRRAIGGFFFLAAILYFAFYVAEHIDSIRLPVFGAPQFVAMAGSVVLYTTSIVLVATIWKVILLDQGIALGWMRTLAIVLISQFGKYLPGNVGQHVGRIYMAKGAGVPIHSVVYSMFLEMVYGVAVASLLAVASIGYFGNSSLVPGVVHFDFALISVVVVASVFLPWICFFVVQRYFPFLLSLLPAGVSVESPKMITAAKIAFLFALCFLISGIIFELQAVWIFDARALSFVEYAALFAIAWVAGYIAPGAPAGLGVREAMILYLFSPLLGAEVSLSLAISFRITTTLGDAFGFLIGLGLNLLTHRKVSSL